VQNETVHFLSYILNEGTRVKNCPEFLAATAESRELPIRASDNDQMKSIIREVVEHKKRQFTVPIIVRNYFLILAHMQRLHHLISPDLQKDLDEILRKAPLITTTMLELAFAHHWLLTAQSMVEFRRYLVQAMDVKSSSLLQIPHFTEETLKHCLKGKFAVKRLQEFLQQSPDERKGIISMNPQEQADALAFCAHAPDLDVEAKVEVEDEKEIVVGDVGTVYVKLTLRNLLEGEAMGPVHAPYFPDPKTEEWWIFLSDKITGDIYTYQRCCNPERIMNEQLQFRVSRPGKQTLNLLIICDSYSGLDKSIDVDFIALARNEAESREVYVHPEDEALDNEPTLFQQMMGQTDLGDSSDDDDVQEDGSQPAKAATAKREVTNEALDSDTEED